MGTGAASFLGGLAQGLGRSSQNLLAVMLKREQQAAKDKKFQEQMEREKEQDRLTNIFRKVKVFSDLADMTNDLIAKKSHYDSITKLLESADNPIVSGAGAVRAAKLKEKEEREANEAKLKDQEFVNARKKIDARKRTDAARKRIGEGAESVVDFFADASALEDFFGAIADKLGIGAKGEFTKPGKPASTSPMRPTPPAGDDIVEKLGLKLQQPQAPGVGGVAQPTGDLSSVFATPGGTANLGGGLVDEHLMGKQPPTQRIESTGDVDGMINFVGDLASKPFIGDANVRSVLDEQLWRMGVYGTEPRNLRGIKEFNDNKERTLSKYVSLYKQIQSDRAREKRRLIKARKDLVDFNTAEMKKKLKRDQEHFENVKIRQRILRKRYLRDNPIESLFDKKKRERLERGEENFKRKSREGLDALISILNPMSELLKKR